MLISVKVDRKGFITNGRDVEVLKNINIEINQKDFIVFLGASGVGKTTILRIILGLDQDYEGGINYNVDYQEKRIVTSIVFQEHRLLPWLTVEENVEFALSPKMEKSLREKKIKDVISLVGLSGTEKFWIKELSGGMAQRVSIARAIVNSPSLLLLDEPFASLDVFTKREIQKELKNIVVDKNITCVMVTHDFDEAIYLGNKIFVLGGKPATIQSYKNFTLDDPNDRASDEFNNIRKWLDNEFFKRNNI